MTQGKQTIEYRLLVQQGYDEIAKKEGILFLLETTKQFTNFSYFVDVKDQLEGNAIVWTLHGLRAPSMNMPSTGTAKFQKLYFDLPRSVRFTLVKKGKIKADTEFTFSKKMFTSSKSVSSFLKIYTDEKEFQSKRLSDVVMAELKPDMHRESPTKKIELKKKKR
jgi:hypothetical protein